MKLESLIPDNEAFVRMVLAKEKSRNKKLNRKVKSFIDRWIIRYYDNVFSILDKYSFITSEGLSSTDRLNEKIQNMYYDPDLSFKSQKEADEFLNRELYWKRFTIQLRIN